MSSLPATTPAAVFLSYAREDSEAARRIAEALRAFGVEVWFDQNELRGGDAWDAKIRKQIKDCALFMPVISANTQARREGYFRLEWKLAVERTHLMMEGAPFLVPVRIDGIGETSAAVPAEFLRVQWMQLPGALPSPQFVEQVRRLLVASDAPGPAGSHDAVARSAAPTPPAPGAPAAPAASAHVWRWLTAGLVVVIAVLIGFIAFRPAATPASPAREVEGVSAPPIRARISAKSIAVLPFTNMSEDKDANAFFSDGIHEDILTNLALIREFTVVSRTSVMDYRGTTKKIRQIGEELGVAYVLEGSVRRAGNTVRVTGQLIDARTDEHVWANKFDRDLTASGVFAIQSELANAIATALHARLSPQEKGLLQQAPTENLAAYELYLKARQTTSTAAREPLLADAVRLDPKFAVAWAHLSLVHGAFYINHTDHTPARVEKAKAAIDTAIRLAPDHPEVINALGRYYYSAFNDYGRALEQYERVVRIQPNNAEVWHSIAAAHRRQGRWPEVVADFHKAVALDPASTWHRAHLAISFHAGRYYEQARAQHRELAARAKDRLRWDYRAALISFEATGSTRDMEAFLARLTPAQAASEDGRELQKWWARLRGDFGRYLEMDQVQTTVPPAFPDYTSDLFHEEFGPALMLAAHRNLQAARERLPDPAKLRARLETEPLNPEVWARLGMTEALLGHGEEAVRCGRRAVELYPESLDAYVGPRYSARLAMIYAWTGNKDQAIADYARLLRTPNSRQNVHVMRLAPEYAPLRGDPRFEALLNDPKNNAPLF